MNLRALPVFLALLSRVIAAEPSVRTTALAPLRLEGHPARAHTQGLEVVGNDFLVTARRDDPLPKRALLLRTRPGAGEWEAWDITPPEPAGPSTPMDHPGGFQSDGTRLWIPVAQSVRRGRSRIRVYPLADLVPGRELRPELDLPVEDHIGALAVSREAQRVVGASWDTEAVHVWDLSGRLVRTLAVPELRSRQLGLVRGPGARDGLAVQDWKFVGSRLLASGLFKPAGARAPGPQSRLVWYDSFLEPAVALTSITVPLVESLELGREAMAVAGGEILLLPEDLGAINRVFHLPLP